MQEFNLKIEYQSGRSNVVADALSRGVFDEGEVVMSIQGVERKEIAEEQARDPNVKRIWDYLAKGELPVG